MAGLDKVLDEEFKPVPGFERYVVSNYGYVLNTNTDRELKPDAKRRIGVMANGKAKVFYLHRLVARLFLPDFEDDLLVVNRNGDTSDNSAANLIMSHQRRTGYRSELDRQG